MEQIAIREDRLNDGQTKLFPATGGGRGGEPGKRGFLGSVPQISWTVQRTRCDPQLIRLETDPNDAAHP
jgi:hypothetical protein